MWSLPIGSQVETSMKRPHKPIINYLSILSLQPGESKVQISIKNQPHQKINDASLLFGRGFGHLRRVEEILMLSFFVEI